MIQAFLRDGVTALQFPVPCFIQRTPAHDGRMITVAFHDLTPLADEILHAFWIICGKGTAPVRILTPNDVANLIGIPEVMLLENFFMRAGAVKAQLHGHIDIVVNVLHGFCGIDTVRVEALIQNLTQEQRFAVEIQFLIAEFILAEAAVGLDGVHDFIPLTQGQNDIIEGRVSRFPKFRILDRNVKADLISADFCRFFGDFFIIIVNFSGNITRCNCS